MILCWDFEDKYFEMLKAGGSKHHSELLAPFGLDVSDPKFWDKGLSMISSMIDELEAMECRGFTECKHLKRGLSVPFLFSVVEQIEV